MQMQALTTRRRRWLAAGIILLAGGAALLAVLTRGVRTEPIDSFSACAEAGYPILESNPPVCRFGSQNFTGPVLTPSAVQSGATSVPFDILVDGDTHSSTLPAYQRSILTRPVWVKYWAEAHAGLPSLPPLIPVDFETDSVVAVSSGSRPTGGYGLKITNISQASTGSMVSVTETTPGDKCITTAAITNRYLIVRSAKLVEPVSFRVNREVRQC